MQPAEPALSLRERRRRETQALIRRAAMRLAVEHGVSEITVHEISRAAGVSPRTFFNHFRSKEEVLVPDLPPFSTEAERRFVDAVTPDIMDALAALLADHLTEGVNEPLHGDVAATSLRLVEANPELLPRLLAVFDSFDRRIARLMAQRTGRDHEDLFCTVAATVATSTVRAGLEVQRRTDQDLGRPDPARVRAAFVILRELLNPPAP